MIVKELMTGDVSPVAMFFCTLPYDSFLMHVKYVSHLRVWPEMDKYLIAKCTQALSKTCPQHV